jgi:hypothetical protein
MASCSSRVNPPFLQRLPNLSRPEMPGFPANGGCTAAQTRRTRHCAAQCFLVVRNWNISRMAVINQSTMYGWDMSAIQIMGFGLAIIWAASFVFLGYLLLPRRSELDQSN